MPRRSVPGKKEFDGFGGIMLTTICAYCGSPMRIHNRNAYTYKRKLKDGRTAWFCSWSHMVKFDNGAPLNRWAKPIQEE